MSNKKKSLGYEFIKGFVKENPLFVLVLGTCPALAVTTSALNGLGMGIATTFVLLMSNFVISLLRKVIPESVRIPAYITIIASLVTVVQFLLQGYFPELDQSLGIYIPLITVNCIILGRAEAFASRNTIISSLLDALGMGLGFTMSLFFMGTLREILGFGTFFGMQLPWIGENALKPIAIFALPAGGFAIFGILVAISNKLNHLWYSRKPETTMDKAHYPGSISERTDAIYAAADTAARSKTKSPGPDAVPEAIKKENNSQQSAHDKE